MASPSLQDWGPVSPPPLDPALTGRWSLGRLSRLLRLFGPAAIIASVSIGAGETIVVVRAGAWAGYGLLWVVLASALVKGVCVTYLLGRYTAISGEPIAQRLVRLPGPRGWLLLIILGLELAAAGPLFAAVARPCGELLRHLLIGVDADPRWGPALATAVVALALGLSLVTSFDNLEKQQVAICGVLVAGTMIGTFLVRPDWLAALRGFASFGRVPEFPPWTPASVTASLPLALATLFGYVGGSVLGYVVYADFISVHGWGMTGHPQIDEIRRRAAAGMPADYLPTDPAAVRQIRRSILPMKWDVALGAAVLLIVTASFMMSGAAVLYPRLAAGEMTEVFTDQRLLTDQATIWSGIHPLLTAVYYICVIAALWGTLQAFPEIYSRVIVTFGKAIWPQRPWRRSRVQLATCGYVMLAATAMLWSRANFDTLTYITSFLTTNLGVAFAMLAALVLNFQLPPAYRTRSWMLAGGVAGAAILFTVSAVSGAGLWRQLFGE